MKVLTNNSNYKANIIGLTWRCLYLPNCRRTQFAREVRAVTISTMLRANSRQFCKQVSGKRSGTEIFCRQMIFSTETDTVSQRYERRIIAVEMVRICEEWEKEQEA